VRAATRDDIAQFHRRHYRTANVIVSAAGLIEHDAIVRAWLAGWTRRPPGSAATRCSGQPPRAVPPAQAARRRLVVPRPTEQAHVMVGMAGSTATIPTGRS